MANTYSHILSLTGQGERWWIFSTNIPSLTGQLTLIRLMFYNVKYKSNV
jgi:hypothetical protein